MLLFSIRLKSEYDTEWKTSSLGPVNLTNSKYDFLSMNLSDLKHAYAEYEVKIKARIEIEDDGITYADENKFSNEASVTFQTGAPNQIPPVNITRDGNQTIISWSIPPHADRPIAYYELRHQFRTKPLSDKIIQINGTSCTLINADCQSKDGSFSVRAVAIVPAELSQNPNRVKSGLNFYENSKIMCQEQVNSKPQYLSGDIVLSGSWSNSQTFSCESETDTGSSYITWTLIIIITIISKICVAIIARKKLKKLFEVTVERTDNTSASPSTDVENLSFGSTSSTISLYPEDCRLGEGIFIF